MFVVALSDRFLPSGCPVAAMCARQWVILRCLYGVRVYASIPESKIDSFKLMFVHINTVSVLLWTHEFSTQPTDSSEHLCRLVTAESRQGRRQIERNDILM